MAIVEIYDEVKFGDIQAKRAKNVNLATVQFPTELENLILEGDPRSIYRTLLNAADKLRSEYAKVGLDFGFDRRAGS